VDWKKTLGSEWRQYEEIFPALNASRIDQVSLECAGSQVPLSLLRLLPDKQLMVGAIQVTPDRVETPEEVAATLKAASAHVDLERILPCTNCGMTPIPYDVALGKLKALGAGSLLARKQLK
jgi:5-methyltetrahydropteroyltriglutamate--homocysteine methyltransferase